MIWNVNTIAFVWEINQEDLRPVNVDVTGVMGVSCICHAILRNILQSTKFPEGYT